MSILQSDQLSFATSRSRSFNKGHLMVSDQNSIKILQAKLKILRGLAAALNDPDGATRSPRHAT